MDGSMTSLRKGCVLLLATALLCVASRASAQHPPNAYAPNANAPHAANASDDRYGSPKFPTTQCDRCGVLHPPEACLGGCQPLIRGVDCAGQCGAEGRWADMRPLDFQPHAQGEYAGPARLAHMAAYRLRPNDLLSLLFVVNRRQLEGEYRLMVGDEVMIESLANDELTRGTLERGIRIQPDGTITVRLLGPVHAAGLTVAQLRKVLEERYLKLYNKPAIDVTPIRTNTIAQDIRDAVGGAGGLNTQAIEVRVTPDGMIQAPIIGSITVQGMTIEELKRELNARYESIGASMVVEPFLQQQADHFVFVVGEVNQPGQFQLQGPTTVSMAIAAAGGWLPEANLRQVVIFRRAEDWRLVSTMVDLRGAMLGKRPTPTDEIWLRDGDLVIVPPAPITIFNDFVRQVFTEGAYAVVPFGGISVNYDLTQ